MICRFEHSGLCCNSGSRHYEYECKKCECMIPISNAERIRAMSDEELTRFKYGGGNPYCKEEEPTACKRSKWVNGLSPCEQCYLDWLRQPAKEDT